MAVRQSADIIAELKGKYSKSLNHYKRFPTREVTIGDIPMGAHHPIRIQSMTTTDTMNTIATVEQTIRMVESGCDYVRITAPSMNEANNLQAIKDELRKRGYNVPLVADIHFTPNAAEAAARIVEKVRVNPGNYVDKKKFEQIDYSAFEYEAELERIRKKFEPLVKICKEYGTAMRIGTNHGSLSDRIMSWYGDTPLGMVESAMEFIRMCESMNYYNLVVSMKSSNAQVMVQAYRMLVEAMQLEGMNYPLHLGVTEAGDGEDGRIKSAVGIGTLLEDGLGDTIRVSLTEDPEFEAPVAKALADRYINRKSDFKEEEKYYIPSSHNPYEHNRRKTNDLQLLGDHHVPVVIADLSNIKLNEPLQLSQIGYAYSALLDKYNLTDLAADIAYVGDQIPEYSFPGNLKLLINYKTWLNHQSLENTIPFIAYNDLSDAKIDANSFVFIHVSSDDASNLDYQLINKFSKAVLVVETNKEHAMPNIRAFFFNLLDNNISLPVIIKRNYKNLSLDELQLYAATDFGALLVDGFGDGIWLSADK
ncbi:MAG: (E)-4-hydroxy-3-methylbut-2-enyl-diphosphate synthase, partial [bacterium]